MQCCAAPAESAVFSIFESFEPVAHLYPQELSSVSLINSLRAGYATIYFVYANLRLKRGMLNFHGM